MADKGVVNFDNQACPSCGQFCFSGKKIFKYITKIIGDLHITEPKEVKCIGGCSVCGYEEDYGKQES